MFNLKKIEAIARYSFDSVERNFLLRTLSKYGNHARILDFGCGNGRFLDVMRANKYTNLIGIETNGQTAREVCQRGYTVLRDLSELNDSGFDVILLSHVIEHFDYKELKGLIDQLSRCLNVGGTFVVFTPLENKKFFFDFDHVKPYPPPALLELFGIGKNNPFQFEIKKQWALEDIFFRKRWFSIDYQPTLYKKKQCIFRYINYLLFSLHLLTFRVVGYKDSYGIAIKRIT